MLSVMEPFPEDVTLPRLTKLTEAFTGERRNWPRAQVHWRVQIFSIDSEPNDCITQNVSSSGFYAVGNRRFNPGSCLDCVIAIPAHSPSSADDTLRVQCRIEVVRSDRDMVENRFGTACRILDYRVIGTR